MSLCNWCGDEMKAGLWEIHKCIEEEATFPEWGIKAVFIHNDTGHTKFDLYENGWADSEVTGIYPAKCGPYESEAEALEAINSWRGDLIAQAATIDTKNEEDLQGYYLDDLVPYLIEKE